MGCIIRHPSYPPNHVQRKSNAHLLLTRLILLMNIRSDRNDSSVWDSYPRPQITNTCNIDTCPTPPAPAKKAALPSRKPEHNTQKATAERQGKKKKNTHTHRHKRNKGICFSSEALVDVKKNKKERWVLNMIYTTLLHY